MSFCQVCRHDSPWHAVNCPVWTGEPQLENAAIKAKAFWDRVGPTPDPIPEFKLPDNKGKYPVDFGFKEASVLQHERRNRDQFRRGEETDAI